jgi:hypothetical protein
MAIFKCVWPTDNKKRQAGKHARKNQETNEKTTKNTNGNVQQKQRSSFLQEYKSKTYTPEDGHVGRNM